MRCKGAGFGVSVEAETGSAVGGQGLRVWSRCSGGGDVETALVSEFRSQERRSESLTDSGTKLNPPDLVPASHPLPDCSYTRTEPTGLCQGQLYFV